MKRAATMAAALLVAGAAVAQLPGAGTTNRPRLLTSAPFTPVGPSQTLYVSIDGSNISTDVAKVATRFRTGGVIADFGTTVDVAPGTGESVAVTVQTGTCGTSLADSAIALSVAGAAIEATDADRVTLAPGECAALKVTTSSGAVVLTPTSQASLF